MLQVVVNNSKRSEEIEFREKVGQTMRKQILKKIIKQTEGTTMKPNCDAPFIVHNNIEQKTKNIL